jgi:SAM-dependent methyltransferase
MSERPTDPCRAENVDLTVPWLEPYKRAAARSGAAFDTLLWRSEEFQRARFRVMAEMIDLSGRVVFDCGCGRADLLAYLAQHDIPYRAYIGIDALTVMVEHCERRIATEKLLRARVLHADFAGAPDAFAAYIRDLGANTHAVGGGGETFVFSGSLNTCQQPHALDILARAWSAIAPAPGAERPGAALAFNFLSASCGRKWAGVNTGPAHRFDPHAMLAFALERTPKVAFRQDYLEGHDATIVMMA